MRGTSVRIRRGAAATLIGSTFLLGGCDQQLRTTVENSVITVSNGLLTATFNALLQLAIEDRQAAQNAQNGS